MIARLQSADGVLHRWAQLYQAITSSSTYPVVGLGETPARRCSGPSCKSRTWTWFADGRRHCARCGRLWPTEPGCLLRGEIDASVRPDRHHDPHRELRVLEALVAAAGLWERRCWILYVLCNVGTYEDLAIAAAQRWPAKHRSDARGFFTPRHVRTLVADARRAVTRRLATQQLLEA